ncbi:MAG: MogA/MoaB family molybdenum cofactor biosynthesis protein [Actinobacteria bacterium]|nr:MogA/MoaB family molybdenum cofactor biosynthesis protein [Actinomycetota bacterium]
MAEREVFRVAILTVSDKGARGERVDEAGPAIREMVEGAGWEVISLEVVPDEIDRISEALRKLADEEHAELILTTGGTGMSPRDLTPEATRAVIDREAPGFAEAMRAASMRITPHAMLSRAVSGVRGCTLIVNLPGSPRAVRENMEVIMPAIPHGLEKLGGSSKDCAT